MFFFSDHYCLNQTQCLGETFKGVRGRVCVFASDDAAVMSFCAFATTINEVPNKPSSRCRTGFDENLHKIGRSLRKKVYVG